MNGRCRGPFSAGGSGAGGRATGDAVFIFDFDGTLADSLAETLLVYNQTAPRLGLRQLGNADLKKLRETTIKKALASYGITLWKLPRIMAALRQGIRERIHHLRPYPEIVDAVQRVRETGARCFVLTSNDAENVKRFLELNGMNVFDALHGGVSLFGKGAQLRRLIRSLEPTPSVVYYVGDEVRDIVAASEAGARSVAVTWGYGNRFALDDANPYAILDAPIQLALLALAAKPQTV